MATANRAKPAIAVTLAVVLAFALVFAAGASAKANGTDRPFRGTASGTFSLNLQTGVLVGHLTGRGSHIGRFNMHVEGSGSFQPDQSFAASGTFDLMTANGDELAGSFTATTSPFNQAGHTATIIMTLESGTGRFADVSGTVSAFNVLTVLAMEGPVLVQHSDVRATGRISY